MESFSVFEPKVTSEQRIEPRIREMAIDLFFNGKNYIGILATYRNIIKRPGANYKPEDDKFAYSVILYAKLLESGLIINNHLQYTKNIVDFKNREKFVLFWIENFVDFDTIESSDIWLHKEVIDAYVNYFGSEIGQLELLDVNSDLKKLFR